MFIPIKGSFLIKHYTLSQIILLKNGFPGGRFLFATSGDPGAGYTGERSEYLYSGGKLVHADRDEDIQVFKVGVRKYLVNESGRIQDSNRFYRAGGEYRYEYNNGTIYYVNNQRQRLGKVTHSEPLPGIAFEEVYTLRFAEQ